MRVARPTVRILAFTTTLIASLGTAVSQTAHQGSKAPSDQLNYEDFKSPMVLDTVFLPTDRSLWTKEWFTTAEYQKLRRFRCELISIVGLEMSAKEIGTNKFELKVRVNLFNPDGGHDKRVRLLFEVLDGDKVAAQFSMPETKVKEAAVVSKTFPTQLPTALLTTEPPATLRLTITTVDY